MGFNPFMNTGNKSSGTGEDGRGIVSIDWISSSLGNQPSIAGAKDTYQIKYTDNTTSTFIVKNGENGNIEIDTVLSEDSGNAIANNIVSKSINNILNIINNINIATEQEVKDLWN